MEEETTTTEKVGPLGYTLGVFLGSSILIFYLAAAILFIFYLLAIIARTYIWIDKFSVFGLGWGVVLGLLSALGVIAASIIGLIIIVFIVNQINQFRKNRTRD